MPLFARISIAILVNIIFFNNSCLSDETKSANVELLRAVVSSEHFPMTIFNSKDPTDGSVRIMPALSLAFKNETESYYGTIAATFYADRETKVTLCCNPTCASKNQKIFAREIGQTSLPRTKYGEYAMRIYFTVNVIVPR